MDSLGNLHFINDTQVTQHIPHVERIDVRQLAVFRILAESRDAGRCSAGLVVLIGQLYMWFSKEVLVVPESKEIIFALDYHSSHNVREMTA